MRSKDLSIQVIQTIVRLQKQNKSIIAGTFREVKSTVWYILRKKEHTVELSNIKRPGRLWRTTVLDDWRILSMVKKNPFTTFSQKKNTLLEVCVSLSVYDQDKTSLEQIQRGHHKVQTGPDFPKKHLKKARPLLENFRLKLRPTCTRMTGRKKYGESLERLMFQSIQYYL